MIRTRRLHARLACAMRVEARASRAYAAASSSARTPRPPVARGSVGNNVDAAGLRIAHLAYVMNYSPGTLAHMMRTRRLHTRLCERLRKVFGARPHLATITYNTKVSVLAARQYFLHSLLTQKIETRLTKEWQPKTRASLVRCICPAQQNSVAASCMANSNMNTASKLGPHTQTDRGTCPGVGL
jgi:hypothetical protein